MSRSTLGTIGAEIAAGYTVYQDLVNKGDNNDNENAAYLYRITSLETAWIEDSIIHRTAVLRRVVQCTLRQWQAPPALLSRRLPFPVENKIVGPILDDRLK